MTVRQYLQQRERRNALAERQFNVRITRALEQSLKYVLEESTRLDGLDQRLESLIDDKPIEDALRWLYVDWGYQQFRWFKKNLPVNKKSDEGEWMRRLEELFAQHGAAKVAEITGTTLELARPIIQDALRMAAEGRSIDVIQQEIRNRLFEAGGVVSPGRARTIARTEVVGASNRSTHEAVSSFTQESGTQVEKAWITGGLNIRDTHKAAERQGYIPMDEPFELRNGNGGIDRMMHPGDPSGSAENVINCKCVLVYRTL